MAHGDDPLGALQVAVNQADLDGAGGWRRYADVDCYASIAGGLLGAVYGTDPVPSESARQVIESNRIVYGFDLEESAARFAALAVTAASN